MHDDRRARHDAERPRALVWIDSREAIIVRWEDDRASIERIPSAIPDHHRSIGHIRHDPAIRHGGGGAQDADASRRLEYLDRFLSAVMERLPGGMDLAVLGPGTVRDHLVAAIRSADHVHRDLRVVEGRAASRLTDRRLVALLRELDGDAAPRRIEHRSRRPVVRSV